MNSNGSSRSNSSIQFDGPRSITTTSDIGDSLSDDDLEWDKSDLTRHLPESDAVSSYDANEMAEILRNRFLEFDMASQIDEYSTPIDQSIITDFITFMPKKDSKREYSLENHSILSMDTAATITTQANRQFLNEKSIIKCRFHRSLADFNSIKEIKSYLTLSKHSSLMDIKSGTSIGYKHLITRKTILTKLNNRKSFCTLIETIEPEYRTQLSDQIATVNSLCLSKLERFRLYIMKLKEKFYSYFLPGFSSTQVPLITQDIIETYDIIEG